VLLPGRYALQTELSHEVPDCVYLALAAREGAALSTADGRLARVARRRSVRALRCGAVGAGRLAASACYPSGGGPTRAPRPTCERGGL